MHIGTFTPVLGTVLELRLDGDPQAFAAAEEAALRAFEDGESRFSTFRVDSELSRWRRGELDECSPDLAEVLAAAAHWYELSAGAFHPATRALTDRWRRAEAEGHLPTRSEVATLAPALPYRADAGRVRRIGDCSAIDLNAIAKGFLVDRAGQAALAVPGISTVVVNAGGDLRHLGAGTTNVGIEDPARPFDNLPPRWRVEIANSALATSGYARRGFAVAGHWLGHVLDPRTGWPVADTASVSVIAADAMQADALATVLGVLAVDEALDFAREHQLGCLIVGADGGVHFSPDWPS
jgi:FAD:protein FMN transferase